jgi:hydrogenase expression/formation protein HypC
MCLAVPAKLVSCTGTNGLADLHGNRVQVSTMLVPDAVPGDWVLIHAGFAIQRVADEEVKRTWDVLKDMGVPVPASVSALAGAKAQTVAEPGRRP